MGENKTFPMQHGPAIPWWLAEIIYEGYSALYGTTQSLERLAERGGLGWAEVEHIFDKQMSRGGARQFADQLIKKSRSGDPSKPPPTPSPQDQERAMNILADLRGRGLMVAVHNDYRLNGEFNTFWLFTTEDGRALKGEGHNDLEALRKVALLLGSSP